MDSETLLAVVGRLEADGIDAWLDGGWGVDALLGHQTRDHDDLDLVVERHHVSRIVELLNGLGYFLVAGAPPKSFVMVDARGRQVDVHPVTFNAEGGGVYEMDDGTEWVYPSEGFTGRGRVDERPVRCLSPTVQVLVHAGYELTQTDYRELYLLRERFGVEPPRALLEHVLAPAQEETRGRDSRLRQCSGMPPDDYRAGVDTDVALMEAWNLGERADGWSDTVMLEVERLLPVLIEAGYADAQGNTWNFTPKGVQRAMELARQ